LAGGAEGYEESEKTHLGGFLKVVAGASWAATRLEKTTNLVP
jgi:hypothetical protein